MFDIILDHAFDLLNYFFPWKIPTAVTFSILVLLLRPTVWSVEQLLIVIQNSWTFAFKCWPWSLAESRWNELSTFLLCALHLLIRKIKYFYCLAVTSSNLLVLHVLFYIFISFHFCKYKYFKLNSQKKKAFWLNTYIACKSWILKPSVFFTRLSISTPH